MRKISLFLCILAFSVFSYAQSQLHICRLDVGQGDSTFIVTPSGKSILIDTGQNGKGDSVVLPFLASLGITHLDYVIASHYHADHIGGVRGYLCGDGLVNHDDWHLLGEYFAGNRMLWNLPEPAGADVNRD